MDRKNDYQKFDAIKEEIKLRNPIETDVLNYLKSRGIEEETINRYGIGFCDGNTPLPLDKERLLKAGLIFENGREYFEGFITFPHWHHGRVIYGTVAKFRMI